MKYLNMDSRLRSLKFIRKQVSPVQLNKENQENKNIVRCASNGIKKLTIDMRDEKLEKIHSRVLSSKQLKQNLGIKVLKEIPVKVNYLQSNFIEKLDEKEKVLQRFYLS